MEIWQIVVIPVLTVLLGFLARPFEIALLRKRTGAINSIRVLSEFLYKYRAQLKAGGALEIVAEIDETLEFPNSVGSEADLAKLIGRICALTTVSARDARLVDRALNALDQRATERERQSHQLLTNPSGERS